MTIDELKQHVGDLPLKLEYLCVGPRHPVEDDGKHCINFENGSWEVFYVERGQKSDRVIFADEHEATAYYLSWVTTMPDLQTHFARRRDILKG
jgi:hypothetical protein